ncbi:MAG: TetR/AcrR family transcriptional regulator [Myxococcota bacterium]
MTAGAKTACLGEAPRDGLAARILDEAIRMFASRGYASTSVREVVEASGCTKPALYYHFTNKVGLYRAAMGAVVARMQHVQVPLEGNNNFAEALGESLARLRAHAERYPDDLRLMFRAESEATIDPELLDIRTLRAQDLAMVESMIALGVERGELRADLPVSMAAIALVGAIHVQLQLWLDGHPLDSDFERNLVSLFMNGVSR